MAEKNENKSAIVSIRIIQAIALGIFALGLSLMSGDYSSYVKSPFSSISMTTTIFGLFGIIITEIMARQAKRW